MPAKCCPECFGDRGLRKNIFQTKGPILGKCNYCQSEGVELLEPAQLSEYFDMLVRIYEPSSTGKPLVEWMKSDWDLFSHPKMDFANAKSLLGDILDDGEIVRRSYAPSPAYMSAGLAQWETVREELLHTNRYFLDETLDGDRLTELLGFVIADDLQETWYRARILEGDEPLPIEQMGAPPRNRATHGRANPVGIPYLYLGSKPRTAIAEIRPHTGDKACVADFTIAAPFTAVDLRNPRSLASPFLLEDSDSIGKLRADIPFLERLGQELTRPVLPKSAALDYIPSQYLCEFIKKNGFHGVIYSSSVSDGINLALFEPTKATPGNVARYKVECVSVDVIQEHK